MGQPSQRPTEERGLGLGALLARWAPLVQAAELRVWWGHRRGRGAAAVRGKGRRTARAQAWDAEGGRQLSEASCRGGGRLVQCIEEHAQEHAHCMQRGRCGGRDPRRERRRRRPDWRATDRDTP